MIWQFIPFSIKHSVRSKVQTCVPWLCLPGIYTLYSNGGRFLSSLSVGHQKPTNVSHQCPWGTGVTKKVAKVKVATAFTVLTLSNRLISCALSYNSPTAGHWWATCSGISYSNCPLFKQFIMIILIIIMMSGSWWESTTSSPSSLSPHTQVGIETAALLRYFFKHFLSL